MAKVLRTDELSTLDSEHTLWAYNAMDCAVTSEIGEKLEPQLDPNTRKIYEFERACLAPAMEMALRGIPVDMFSRSERMAKLQKDAGLLEELLFEYGNALGYPQGINANSVPQLKKVFYDDLGIPEKKKYNRQKKEESVSVDREAMEKIALESPIANPLVKAILARRECVKKLSVLRSGIDADSRMRFSFNVGGTETGRWSSSRNAFGGGMNAQNITEELRPIFIAGKGKKLAYVDLEQAESRAVAYLSGDEAYTQACQSGDLHTTVTRLIWPGLAWTGDLDADRKLADSPFYRQYSYRDMAKRGGHGSNYLGTPRTMAIHLKVETKLMEDFQQGYFSAFPNIRTWHQDVASELQTQGALTTPFGRKRHFLGRLGDNSTLREAVAYVPQSLIADYMNAGVCRIWSWNKVDLLAQVHDAVLFEYPEDRDDLAFAASRILSQTIILQNGDAFSIPSDIAVGWNWGKYWDEAMNIEAKARGEAERPLNLDGIKKLKPGKPDTRTRRCDPANPLARVLA